MPMPATITRSLGGTAPSRPKTELGINIGATAAAPAVLMNCRRARCFDGFDMIALLLVWNGGIFVI
jgi:hypothetical protein